MSVFCSKIQHYIYKSPSTKNERKKGKEYYFFLKNGDLHTNNSYKLTFKYILTTSSCHKDVFINRSGSMYSCTVSVADFVVDFILESDFVAHYSFSVKWYKSNSWPKNQKFPLKLATLVPRVLVSLSRASFLLQYSWVLTSIRNTDKSLMMMMMKSLIIMHDFIWSYWANGRYVSVPVPTVPLPIFPKNRNSTKLAGPLLDACMF